MVALFSEGIVDIPESLPSLDAFCDWVQSPDYPEFGRFSFLRGKLWMETEMELLFLHNLLKLEFGSVLHALSRSEKLGYLFTDGAFLRNAIAGIATIPDALFVSYESLDAAFAELVAIKGDGPMIVSGVPDMVLEIVSGSSVVKDTIELRDLYWQAGIPEYWLVDARVSPAKFDILKLGSKAYVPTRKVAGWLKSNVFGHSFRVMQQKDKLGNPQFTLEIKE